MDEMKVEMDLWKRIREIMKLVKEDNWTNPKGSRKMGKLFIT